MNQVPCPNCGELLACGDEGIGRKVRCPRCRVMLRLDADAEGRPTYRWPRRRFPLLALAIAVGAFLAGLGIGVPWGASMVRPTANHGISATSVGFFGASNTVIVDDSGTPPKPPPKGAASAPGGR